MISNKPTPGVTENRVSRQSSRLYRAGLSWIAISLVDGSPICELPYLQADTIEYHLMEGTSQTFRLPYDGLPVNWKDACRPGGVAYILLQDETPIWGGILMDVGISLSKDSISLKVDTIETYLERCPTGDLDYTRQDQNLIVADLIYNAAIQDMHNCLAVSYWPSERILDRTYKDTDDKSVLSAIQELANLQGGPEWGHWWVRTDDGRYHCLIESRDHYGSEHPVTDFTLAQMTGFERDIDASGDSLANKVRAVSTAEGDRRPSSGWVSYADRTRPVWPLSYAPSTSIKDQATLESHARRRLAASMRGAVTHSVTLDLLTAPRLGVEWKPGDLVRWDVSEAEDRLLGRGRGVARVIGYKISFQGSWSLTPVLQEMSDEQEETDIR